MRPESLLRHFDVMVEAPGGVQKLRELILQLAVRGKLVPQDPGDEPASVLLERIAADRRRLFKEGKIAKPKPLPPINEDEVPFAVPAGWEWVRIGAAGELLRGVSYSKSDASASANPGYVPVLRGNNIDGVLNFDGLVYVKAGRIRPDQYIQAGDVLIAMSSGSKNLVGKAAQATADFPGAFGAFCGLFRRYHADVDPYLRWFFQSEFYRMGVSRASQGIGINNLRKSDVEEALIPLPPLPEQRRIVAKVDELMALCDELETRQQRRAEARMRLNRSALNHLTAATGDAELAAHWERLQENFHLPYDTPETVAELRQAVVQLAVRGRLVPQDPGDEPASVLLERIASEKQRLFEEGKIGRPRPPPGIVGDEAPFAVPAGWEWTRLVDVIVDGPRNGHSPKPVDYPTFTRAITLTATTSGAFDGRHFKYIGDTIPVDSCYWLVPGDLLFQRGNTIGYVGTAAVYDGEAHSFIYPDLMIRVRCSDLVSVRFVHLVANSFIGRHHFRGRASGTSGSMPKINQADVLDLRVPLPPLTEQRRIVAKVDELMALCDHLEAQLTAAREKSTHLSASVVHHFTAA